MFNFSLKEPFWNSAVKVFNEINPEDPAEYLKLASEHAPKWLKKQL